MKRISLLLSFGFVGNGWRTSSAVTAGGEKESPSERCLIVHADGAGMSHSVNRPTMNALEAGMRGCASIRVPCAWFKEFALDARRNPRCHYETHLTWTSERDCYGLGPVADNDLAEAADRELRVQIDRALKPGVLPGHPDTGATVFARSAAFRTCWRQVRP